ncbi:MAG: AtpZ/AtpI family protein [Planctomycetes bacterium]|nr:AtpZ/AtpI family protein [Planctomycetota bacterium]
MAFRGDDLRTWAGIGSIGPVLAAGVLFGYFVGDWLDRRFGTQPWCMVVGLLLGSAGGFVEVFAILQKYSARKK